MKLLLREYVASLKERDELDAILPDMLSEGGFHVYSRPARGTNQYGVDVAAVGPDEDGETKLFLLSIKRGDLTRAEWNAPAQGLHASLIDIIEVYLRSHVPAEYAQLKVVICLCVGGRILENVRERVSAFEARHTSETLTFQEWDDDRIAGMLATGILSERSLPRPMRSAFQKAVALVDEPDVAFAHFCRLLNQLHEVGQEPALRVRSARQIYLCLWILFVWARDADNFEAPYRASERALLTTWDLLKSGFAAGSEFDDASQAIATAFEQMAILHMSIGETYLNARILPFAQVRHGLSAAVGSPNGLDVNLKLFETVGRLAQSGLWLHWMQSQPHWPAEQVERHQARIRHLCDAVLDLVEANPAVQLPIADYQTADIVSAFVLFMAGGVPADRINDWFGGIADRFYYAVRLHRRYTTSFTDYRDLVEHPRERTESYRDAALQGSTLIPFLGAWFARIGDEARLRRLTRMSLEDLKACTLQSWLPDETSETHLYRNTDQHGRALTSLPMSEDGLALSNVLERALDEHGDMNLSAEGRCWPLIILACRHWGLPIPPQFWFHALTLKSDDESNGTAEPAALAN